MLERIHLRIVDEVQKLGSLTAAAEALHLTQSALSHSIKKLEQHMGAPIWQRDGRQLRLTQSGAQVLALAQRVLPQFMQTEALLRQLAQGMRGSLRIGMECHPCYEWLLQVVSPYLSAWPDVDVDVRQKFQFGGLAALQDCEIDMLVTPDPLRRAGLHFEAVFDYEQVLVVAAGHPWARLPYVAPEQLAEETLITYPVSVDRLDVFALFLTPAGCAPAQHKTIETTEIMLQMVASGRGVAALPKWLVQQYSARMPVRAVKMGRRGCAKQIHLGLREADLGMPYVRDFIERARRMQAQTQPA